MNTKVTTIVAAAALLCLLSGVSQALTPYTQTFEGMPLPAAGRLIGDGWLVYGNAFNPSMVWMYGYGPYPAPNDGAAFCAVATGEGGVDQGSRQLSVYGDYQNQAQGGGNWIQANIFKEQTIVADDVGDTWVFAFQAKMGNLGGGSTAMAFIKTIDPASGYAMTNFVTADMTAIPATWGGYQVSLTIDAGLVGQLFQFGFMNLVTLFEPSGIFYDNVDFHLDDSTAAPAAALPGVRLAQNHPNPFNPSTRVEFALDAAGPVEVAVYDLGGRRIAVLADGTFAAGAHSAVWDGRDGDGRAAPAGQYRCVLRTAAGDVSRSMTLVK
ncbi:MAG: hypothetical protein IPI34_14720 [bacterium]|nr:hypothetical protein [bacterium]